VGDCIVAVNEVSTVNVTHQDAVQALKAAGGVVTLVIFCSDLTLKMDTILVIGSNYCLLSPHNLNVTLGVTKECFLEGSV